MDKKNNINGILVFFINIVLCLFIMSTDFKDKIYVIVAMFSSLIAIIFNIYMLIKIKKKTANIAALVLNVLTLTGLIIYFFKLI